MVRNTQGGSGHKSQARKLVSSGRGPVRTKLEDGAHFAMVNKLFGNGMCEVITDSGEPILCYIRGKFRGRNKSNNLVGSGSLVMIGLRDFSSKKKECDLLEVYDIADVRVLRATPGIDLTSLDQAYASKQGGSFNTQTDGLEFTNDAEPIFNTFEKTIDENIIEQKKDGPQVNIVDFDDI
jgi:translation initiation factor IF-1